mmetsp:Transcript_55192/g.107965  ORF Transcript_55192/g.107965 Transcript_55192/m.107965 type:complete len:204 (+) Transcript_55192:873-1484(+)
MSRRGSCACSSGIITSTFSSGTTVTSSSWPPTRLSRTSRVSSGRDSTPYTEIRRTSTQTSLRPTRQQRRRRQPHRPKPTPTLPPLPLPQPCRSTPSPMCLTEPNRMHLHREPRSNQCTCTAILLQRQWQRGTDRWLFRCKETRKLHGNGNSSSNSSNASSKRDLLPVIHPRGLQAGLRLLRLPTAGGPLEGVDEMRTVRRRSA